MKYETIKDKLKSSGIKYKCSKRMARFPYASDRSLTIDVRDLVFAHDEIDYALAFEPDKLRTIQISPQIEGSDYTVVKSQYFHFDKRGIPRWIPGWTTGESGISTFEDAEKVIHFPPEKLISGIETLLDLSLPEQIEGAEHIIFGMYDIPRGGIGRSGI